MAQLKSSTKISSIQLAEQGAAPGTPASGYGQLYAKDDGKLYFKDDGGNEYDLTGGGSTPIYPQSVILLGDQFKIVAGGGTINHAVNTAQRYNYYTGCSTNTNGDAIETAAVLKVGTYDVVVLGVTAGTRGILDWSCDGVNFITGQDWYSAAATYNVVKTGTLVISASGRHLIRATVNGKNASSSNYVLSVTAIILIAQTLATET